MTTIFTATLNTNDGGNDGLSFRNVLSITGGAQGQVRVTFKASSASGWHIDHAAIGISTGTLSNTNATPVELTFSGGASGFNILAGASITSDWVNLTGFTSSDKLVVIADWNAAGGGNSFDSAAGPALYFASGASYTTAVPGYALSSSAYAFVGLIEVQSAGGAAVSIGGTGELFSPQLGPEWRSFNFRPQIADTPTIISVEPPRWGMQAQLFAPRLGPKFRDFEPVLAYPTGAAAAAATPPFSNLLLGGVG